jgi:hypothetical protein
LTLCFQVLLIHQLILIPLIGDGKLNVENFVRFWWNFHRCLKNY